jgi:hypothetical protein
MREHTDLDERVSEIKVYMAMYFIYNIEVHQAAVK